MVRRDHARVARVELIGQAISCQRLVQGVDPVGHVQRRPFVPLGQKVAHGPVHRPCQPDVDVFGGHDGERAIDGAHGRRVAALHVTTCLLEIHVRDAVERRVEQVDHTMDGLHTGIVKHRCT